MSVEISSPAIVLREKLAQIVPFDPNPNFESASVQNQNIVESGDGWIKFYDGTMIHTGNSVVGAVTLNPPFIDTDYNITLGSGSNVLSYATAKLTSGFTLNGAQSDYIAIGKFQ